MSETGDPWRLKYNDLPVCPYCGHEDKGAWELDFGPGLEGSTETDCGKCERPYFVERQASITYTTAALSQSCRRGDKGYGETPCVCGSNDGRDE